MKTTTFKNICSPSTDKTIIIGTNTKNERWFFSVDSRQAAASVAKAIMAKKGKVNLTGLTACTVQHERRPGLLTLVGLFVSTTKGVHDIFLAIIFFAVLVLSGTLTPTYLVERFGTRDHDSRTKKGENP